MPALNSPVVERIAVAVKNALADIRQAAGYGNNFTVRRRNVRGNAPEASQVAAGCVFAVMIQPSPRKLSEENYETIWEQPFWIDLYVCPDEDNAEELDTRINSARADCEYALCNATNRTWGGLADDTKVDDPQPFQGPGLAHGIQVRIVITYRHYVYEPRQAVNDQ